MEVDDLILDTISVTSVHYLYLMQKTHSVPCFNLWGVVWLFHDNCLNGKMMLNVLFF
jgi:hypothetical protein